MISRLVAGELGATDAARALGLSERGVRRLPAHGARWAGRTRPRQPGTGASSRRAEETRARIIDLSETTYARVNDSHLAELLAKRDGITTSRSSLRRLLRDAAEWLERNGILVPEVYRTYRTRTPD